MAVAQSVEFACGLRPTEFVFMVLYGWESWSLILKEEHKPRVFENRVLRRLFGQRRDGMAEGWINRHDDELHNLYSSPSKIRIIKSRRMRWAGHVARIGEKRNVYRILLGSQRERDH
jgi:hypothetical protein